MTEDRISAHGVTVTITRSAGADDAVVVYVDTEGLPDGPTGPECRILLNDEPVYVGAEYVPVPDVTMGRWSNDA